MQGCPQHPDPPACHPPLPLSSACNHAERAHPASSSLPAWPHFKSHCSGHPWGGTPSTQVELPPLSPSPGLPMSRLLHAGASEGRRALRGRAAAAARRAGPLLRAGTRSHAAQRPRQHWWRQRALPRCGHGPRASGQLATRYRTVRLEYKQSCRLLLRTQSSLAQSALDSLSGPRNCNLQLSKNR